MSDLEKEFPGLLYNKLWENVIQKENRLWTFLSVYGAAVGIVIGTRISDSSLRIEASFVILVLTYWAAELILDSDWWSVRNRMMIERIERSAEAQEKGWIPTFYRGARYASESLIRVCLAVFVLIGLIAFWMAISQVCFDKNLTSVARATWTCALYSLAVFAVLRCEHVRETQIKNYYDCCMDLDRQADKRAERSSKEERRDRHAKTGRPQALIIAIALNAVLFLRFREAMLTVGLWLGIVNFIVVMIYLSISTSYYSYPSALQGKDAGFVLIDRDRDTGNVKWPKERHVRHWLIGNWMLAASLLVSVVCLWFVVESTGQGKSL